MTEAQVTVIAAVAFSVVGVGLFFHFYLWARNWPKAVGRVIGNVSQRRSTDGDHYAEFPIIEFHAGDGQRYEFLGDIGRNVPWPLGQQLALRYRAGNPNHATILTNGQRLLFSAVFLIFAMALWAAWWTGG